MPSHDEIINVSAAAEGRELITEKLKPKTALDYFALALATCGVGYLPLAPGTWGSAVGVLIYLIVRANEFEIVRSTIKSEYSNEIITAWTFALNAFVFLIFCFLGIWASGRAVIIFKKKDPQKVVVDEVIGQLIVFLFVPFGVSWKIVLAGFILFRLFDIWKPYPISSLENLPAGLGVCADDILAGVYGGICLALLFAGQTFF